MLMNGQVQEFEVHPRQQSFETISHHGTPREMTIFRHIREGNWQGCLEPKVTLILANLQPIQEALPYKVRH